LNDSLDKPNLNIAITGNISGNVVVGDGNTVIHDLSMDKTEKDVFFDAGDRLRQVRNEINLKSSEFVEELGFSSEKKYLAIEKQDDEAPLSLLKKTQELTGISLEWLKHGKPPRYKIGAIYLHPVEAALQVCAKLKPQEYFFTLETKGLHVGIVAQTGKYRYQALETGINLNFWAWAEQPHWAVLAFYKFLKAWSESWHDIYGMIINPSDDKKLYKGEIHFLSIEFQRNVNLVYDILDIDESRLMVSSYSRVYGGNWMHKVHDTFKAYLKRDAENKG